MFNCSLSWFSISQLYIVRCLWKDIYLCIRYKTNKNWPESSSWLRLTFAFMLLADASTPKQHIAHILCLLKPRFAIFSHAIQWKSTGNMPSFVYIPTCCMLSLLLMLIVRLKMQQSFMLYIEIKWTVNKHPMIVVYGCYTVFISGLFLIHLDLGAFVQTLERLR